MAYQQNYQNTDSIVKRFAVRAVRKVGEKEYGNNIGMLLIYQSGKIRYTDYARGRWYNVEEIKPQGQGNFQRPQQPQTPVPPPPTQTQTPFDDSIPF